MKYTEWIIISIACMSLFVPGCSCQKEVLNYEYKFVEKVNLNPAKKLYNLGDTVWIEYSNPGKFFFDSKTNENKFSDSSRLNFALSLTNHYAITFIDTAAPYGNFISAQGINVNQYNSYSGSGISLQVGCNTGNNYDFKIAVVFKQRGTYALSFNTNLGYVMSCSNPSASTISSLDYRFDLADCNKDIYLDIPEHRRGSTGFISGLIDNKQMFFFRVL